jgi:hypothetical protein
MRKSVSFIITLFVLCANVSTLSAQKVMMDVAKERALSFFSQSYGTGLVARKAQRGELHNSNFATKIFTFRENAIFLDRSFCAFIFFSYICTRIWYQGKSRTIDALM